MQTPLVSIIVPIYKVEPYLRRCLDSIVNQSYTNLEIILVDDGSPDGCPQICDEYAAKDKRIFAIHKENGGLSDARNAGLDISKGEYVSFIDSDDWVNEKYIEILLAIMTKEKSDIVIGENEKTKETCIDKTISKTTIKTYTSKEALIHLFRDNHIAFTVSWGKLYKRNLFETLRFPVGKFHEDEFTTYILFYNAKKIIYTSEILYIYFQRNNSIITSRHPWDVLEFLEKRYLFFKERNEKDLLSYLLPPLCWQYLCAYWYEKRKKNEKKIYYFQKFNFYIQDLKKIKISLFHRFALKLFNRFPQIYCIYRNISPFLIRKDF